MTTSAAEIDLLLAALGVTGLGAAGVWALNQPSSEPLVMRRVDFGSKLGEDEVSALLASTAGLARDQEVRLVVRATAGRIEHGLVTSRSALASMSRAVDALAENVRLSDGGALSEWRPGPAYGSVLSWSPALPVVRGDQLAAGSAAVLGSMTGLGPVDKMWLQLVLRPSGPVRRPDPVAAGLRQKLAGQLLRARLVLAVESPNRLRSRQLLARLQAAIHTRSTAAGFLRTRPLGLRRTARAWQATVGRGQLLSIPELVPLLAWPIDAPPLVELSYGLAPLRMASPAVPSGGPGRLFGTSTWPGAEDRRVIQPSAGSSCHSLLLGPTGSGKSWLLAELLLSQIDDGDGVVLLDMKGDTAADVLARIPQNRRDQVLVIEPGNSLPVPGLRSFAGEPELSADLLLAVFRGLFPATFGVRSERYLRMVFQTLPHDRQATLADALRLLSDERYRRRLVGRLDDPLLIGQWAEFEALSPGSRQEHLASPLGKLAEVLSRRVVRTMLAQAQPKLTATEAIGRGMIVVASLPPGQLGTPASQLLGALVIHEAYQAVTARQRLPAAKRLPVGIYIDEPAVLGSLPVPLDSLFETARGMNCGLTLAAQSLGQLPNEVQRAALSNAATIAAFRPAADDATRLARELPGLSRDELQLLAPYTVALRLGLGPGRVAPVCTLTTPKLRAPISQPDQVRRHSAEQFGRPQGEVDDLLRARYGLAGSEGFDRPLGVRRRAS